MLASKDDEKSHVASTVETSLLDSTVAEDSITSIDDTVTVSNGAYDHYTDVTDISYLENKPMNHKYTAVALWLLQGLQFALVVIALTAVWSKTRLYNDADNSIITTLSTTDVKSNIEMYADGNAYDIVLLIAVFCVFFPVFRFILFAFGTIMHTKYLASHNDWPIRSTEQAESIVKEKQERLLMPWWKGVSVKKDWFSTKESSMKIGSISVDLLVSVGKFSFAQTVLSSLLNNVMAVRFDIDAGNDGGTITVEINSETFIGFVCYGFSMTCTFAMIALLVWQRICWLRSYKERAVRGLTSDRENSKVPGESIYGSAPTTSLAEPLLSSSSNDSGVFEEPSELDYKLAALWCVSLSSWLAMALGVDLIEVKYSGQWNEGMEYDNKASSFYELSSGSFTDGHETNPIFRYFMICNWTLLAIAVPTLTLITIGYLVLSKLSKNLYNERLYNKAYRVLRVLFPCSTHEATFAVMVLFIIEVERVTDPLLNDSDNCDEEKCLSIKGQFTSGLLCMGIYAMSVTLTYRLLLSHYNYVTYKL